MQDRRNAAFILGIGFVLVVLALMPHVLYKDRVLPRVSSGGIPVGGLGRDEALQAVAEAAGEAATSTKLTVRDPTTGMTWTHSALELGGVPDPEETVERLLEAGRTGFVGRTIGPWLAILTGKDVPLAWVFSPEPTPALQAIIDTANVAPTNARIDVVDGRNVPIPSSPGRAVNVDATLEVLAAALESGSVQAEVQFDPTGARVGAVEDVATAWEIITSSPLRIAWEGEILAEVPVEELRAWFRLEDVTSAEGDVKPTIMVDRNAIVARIVGLAPLIQRLPEDTRFALDEQSRMATVLRAGRSGASLNVERTVDRVIDGAYSRQRVAEVAADLTPSRFAPEDAGLLHGALPVSTTYIRYTASPPGREANLRAAAEAMAGVALGPGQELSFLETLGDVTAEKGYVTAFLRPQPEAAPGWTGGIEQVSTGFYRAAMLGGLMVRQRHPVPFRVGWLEPPVGFDAAVEAPTTDLIVTNPTESYLLFASAIDAGRESLVVSLLASPPFTPTVQIGGPVVTDITPPGEEATVTAASLPADQAVQIGWAREGAAVLLLRTASLPGGGLITDSVESVYAPARKVTANGTAR